jgi:hypothetical protein
MTISNDLMLAILAMDSYNQNYAPGLEGVDESIGEATQETDSSEEIGLATTQAAGFYAASYTWNGKTVISYRGTDSTDVMTKANDIWGGVLH